MLVRSYCLLLTAINPSIRAADSKGVWGTQEDEDLRRIAALLSVEQRDLSRASYKCLEQAAASVTGLLQVRYESVTRPLPVRYPSVARPS